MDSVGEGEGGKIWENGIETCNIMYETSCQSRFRCTILDAWAKDPLHKRFELRNPDATCNPYYAFSAILMAGLDGIEKKIDPHAQGWGPFDCNLYDLPAEEKAKLGGLPTSLSAAAEALRKDHEYLTKGGVFPQRLIDLIVEDELHEDAELAKYPHPKEFAMYYDL